MRRHGVQLRFWTDGLLLDRDLERLLECACCRGYNGDLAYGNIRDSSPKELINCEEVLELRRRHPENRIPKGSLCASCECTNPAVSQLFRLFVSGLVQRFSDNWKVEKMQGRFDEFLTEFSAGMPDGDRFAALIRA